jgi:hypothetical protein
LEADIKRFAIFLKIIAFGAIFAPVPATLAQPPLVPETSSEALPTEKIIVTAPRVVPDATISDFIKSYAAPSPLIGKIARWREGVCPVTVGLSSGFNEFVTQRVKEVATLVGAPVQKKDQCKFNIDIVFTLEPDELLYKIRTHHPVLLGYHDVSQAKRIATVSHPIQAWYTTQTEDQDGVRVIDNDSRNLGVELFIPPQPGYPNGEKVFLPDAREEHVDLTHLGDGLRSEFYHIVIVADSNKVATYQIGPISDYIAMLALSQTQAFDACQELSSITNLLSPGCEAKLKASAITDNDTAYLRALYQMNPELALDGQRGDIAGHMKNILTGR